MAAEINVPIKLQIANLQDVTKSMRSELSTLRVDSTSYKKLAGVITDIERRIAALQVKASHPFINAKQFADAEKDVNAIEDDLYKLRIEAGKIKFGDLSLSTAQVNSLKEFDQKLAEIDQKIKKVSEDAKTAFLSSDTGKAWAEGKSDSQLKSMESITKAIEREVQTRKKQYDEAVKNEQDYKARMAASRKLSAWIKGGHELSEETMGDTYAKVFQTTGKNAGNFKAGGSNLLKDWLMNQFQLPKDVVDTLVQNSGKAVVEAFKSLEGETDKLLKEEAAKSRANAAEQRKTTNSGRTYAEARMRAKADLDKTEKVQGVANAAVDQEARAQAELRAEYAATNQARQTAQTGMAQTAATQIATGSAASQAAEGVRNLRGAFQEGGDAAAKYDERISKLSGISNFINRYIGIYAVMRRVVSAVRDAFNTIKELDKNITNIAVVTNMSQEDLWGKIGEYTAIAQQYGVATKDVYTVSQIFYQQGLQTSQVMELTTETLKMAKIAGMEYSDAANAMTVAVRAFKIEMSEAQQVTDTYSALAAKFAVSSAEIANAMEKTASSAASVGMSLQSTSAFMSVMIQTTRESAQNIGSAMKSIISRYGEMKASPASLLNVDGEEVAFNKVDTALKSIGISIKDASGQFRDFDDVIIELAKKWDTLDNNTQRYIATIMAGNRQQSRFIALVSNYDELSRAVSTADTAENASIVQVAKTMDSLETKAQQVQNAFSQLYLDLHIENGLKAIYDWLANILKTIGKLGTGGVLTTLGNILGFGGGFKGAIEDAKKLLNIYQNKKVNVDATEANKVADELNAKLSEPVTKEVHVQTDADQAQAQMAATLGLNSASTNLSSKDAITLLASRSGKTNTEVVQTLQQFSDKNTGKLDTSTSWLLQDQFGISENDQDFSALDNFLTKLNDTSGFNNLQAALDGLTTAVDQQTNSTNSAGQANQGLTSGIESQTRAVQSDTGAMEQHTSKVLQGAQEQYQLAKEEYQNIRETQTPGSRSVEMAEKRLRKAARDLDRVEKRENKSTKEKSKKPKKELTEEEQNKRTARLMAGIGIAANVARMAGTAITAIGAAHEDKSTDTLFGQSVEKSKIYTGVGNGLSMAGTGASMGMAFGPWGALIGAIGGFLIGGLGAIIDGANMSLAEKIALQQNEAQKAQDETLKAQAKATDIQAQLQNLKQLQAAMHNSNDDMKAYQEAMTNLGANYPELISMYDSAGNVVIDLTHAEEVLAETRLEGAKKAREAAKNQLDVAESELETWDDFDSGSDLRTFLTALNTHSQNTGQFFNISSIGGDKQLEALGITPEIANKMFEGVSQQDTIDFAKVPEGFQQEIQDIENWFKEYQDVLKLSSIHDISGHEDGSDWTVDEINAVLAYMDAEKARRQQSIGHAKSVLDSSIGTETFINLVNSDTTMTPTKRNTINTNEMYQGLFNSALAMQKGNYATIYDWQSAKGSDFVEVSDQIYEQFALWYNKLNDKLRKEFTEIDFGSFKNANEIATHFGIDTSTKLYSGLKQQFIDQTTADRNRILQLVWTTDESGNQIFNTQALGNLLGHNEDVAQLIAEAFNNQDIISNYADYFVTQLLEINRLAEQGLSASASARINALDNLRDFLINAQTPIQDELFTTITSIDWNSFDSITNAIKLINTYKESITDPAAIKQLNGLTNDLQDAADSLVFNVNTLASELTSGIIKAAKDIESLASANKSGLSLDSALEAFKKLSASAETGIKSFTQAFTFDESLGKYVYTAEGLLASFRQKREQLEKEQAQLAEQITTENNFFGQVGTSGKAEVNQNLLSALEGNTVDEWETQIAGWNQDVKEVQLLQNTIKNFKTSGKTQNRAGFEEYLQELIANNDAEAKAAQAAFNELDRNERYTLAHNIDWGQLVAGNGTAADTAMAQRLAESLGIEALDENSGQKITDWYQSVLTEYLNTLDGKAKDQFERAQKNAHQIKLDSAYKDIISNWSSIDETQRVALEDALGKDKYQEVADYLIDNKDGTYTLNWSELLKHKSEFSQAVKDTIEQTAAQIFDDATAMFSKGGDFFSKGTTSQADMESFANEMQKLFNSGYIVGDEWKNVSVGKIFEFDELTKTSKLTEEAWKTYIEGEKNRLIDLKYSDEEIQRILTSTAAQQVDIEGFIKDARSMERGSRAREALKSQIQNWNIVKTGESLDDAILENYASAILRGGDFAVNLMREIANDRGEELSTDQIEAIYRAKINELNKAQETLLTVQVGHALDTNTASILSALGVIKTNKNGIVTEVTTDIDKLVAAHESLYNQLSQAYGTTVADLNKAYAQVLNVKDRNDIDAISAMQNAMGMTYEALGDMLSKYNINLKDWLNEHTDMYERVGGGKIRITDFAAFAEQMGWQPGSEEYTSAFKAYNDSLIALNQQTEKAIVEEAKNIGNAKVGDQINVTTLWDTVRKAGIEETFANAMFMYGAKFKDGILTLTENANIPAIINEIAAVADEYTDILPDQLAELSDAIREYLSKITNLIKSGITGSLSNVDANQLRSWAFAQNIGTLDFSETKEGLKLSETSAINLYNTLKSIDAMQGQLVFDELSNSLKENNENFKSFSSIASHIKRINDGIYEADGKTSKARLKQYQAELSVAQEILATRLTGEDDSFNFMSGDIPAAQKNPLNYAKNWTEAFKTIKEAFKVKRKGVKGGYIDYEDWYNIVNEMNNIAALGGPIKMGAIELKGDLESASNAIQKGANALVAVDTGELKVNLADTGINIKSGADMMNKGVEAGIHEMAHSQVQMLDGLIKLLETIVAMESLSDVDVEGNGIELDDLFKVTYNSDGSVAAVEFQEAYDTWRQNILKQIKETNEDGTKNEHFNKELSEAMGSISIDGHTLSQLISWDTSNWSGASKELINGYSDTLAAFYQAALSGNYDLGNIAESVKEVLIASGLNNLTVDIGDTSLIISGGRFTSINWADADSKALIQRLKKEWPDYRNKTEQEIRTELTKLMSQYQAGEELGQEQLEWMMELNHHISVKDGKKTITWRGETYDAGTPEFSAALAAWRLADAGINFDRDLTDKEISSGTIKTTTTIGSVNNIEVISNGTTILWKSNLTGKTYNNEQDLLNGEYDYYVRRQEAEHPLDTVLTKEEWLYSRYNIRVKTESKVTGPSGNNVNVSQDPAVRQALKDYLNNGDFSGILPTKDGNYQIKLPGGYIVNLDGSKVEGVDGDLDTSLVPSEIMNLLNIDESLADAVTQGIKNAFGEDGLPIDSIKIVPTTTTVEEGLDIEPIEEASVKVNTLRLTPSKVVIGSKTPTGDGVDTPPTTADLPFGQAPFAATAPTPPTQTQQTVVVSAETTEAKTALENVNTQVVELGQQKPKIEVPTPAILRPGFALDTLKKKADNVDAADPTITISAVDAASPVINDIEKTIDNLNNKVITITAKITEEGSPAGAGGNFHLDQALVNASGNIGGARSKGTLMGELGPELVVSNGRYFVAGQSGAEFVDLADDAIVFNHLQTEQLLKKGMSPTRGRAITNERTAIAYAKGSMNGGPAMASASAALAALKQLRAMWARLESMSVADLAGLGGSGGGGGGSKSAFIKQLDRWYTYLQKIAELEKVINREELRRTKIQSDMVPHGQDFASSQLASLEALRAEVGWQQKLVDEQKKYFDQERARLNDKDKNPFAALYTFDEAGQIVYQDGALAQLSEMSGTDKYGNPNMTPEQQFDYIVNTLGIDTKYLQTDSSGAKIEYGKDGRPKDAAAYAAAVQAFYDKMEADQTTMQGLFDSINEHQDALLQAQQQQNEIMRAIEDNQISVENRVLNAMVDARQREIDELQKQRDAIQEASDSLIDGLNDQLKKERDMYNQQQKADELTGLQRRLSILQRSGGSASEIANLQKQINDKQQDAYFDAQQAQIDALQQASDAQLDRLDSQIDLMTEQLAYEKENGLLWGEVADIMRGSPEQIAAYISQNDSSLWGNSPTKSEQEYRQMLFEAQQFVEFRDRVEGGLTQLIQDNTNASADASVPESTITDDMKPENFQADQYKQIKGDMVNHKKKVGDKWVKDPHIWDSKGKRCLLCNIKKVVQSVTDSDPTAGTTSGGGGGGGGGGGDTSSKPPKTPTEDHCGIKSKKWEYDSAGHWYETIFNDGTKKITKKGPHKLNKSLKCKCGYKDEPIPVKPPKPGNGGGPAKPGAPTLTLRDNQSAYQNIGADAIAREAVISTFWDAVERNQVEMQNMYGAVRAKAFDGDLSEINNSTVFEKTEVILQFDKMSSDYDAKRAGQVVMDEMMRIAQKQSGSNRINRR